MAIDWLSIAFNAMDLRNVDLPDAFDPVISTFFALLISFGTASLISG